MTSLSVLLIIGTTIFFTTAIERYSWRRRDLQLHSATWLADREAEWHQQLQEQYERQYAEDLQDLTEENEKMGVIIQNLSFENEQVAELLKRSGVRLQEHFHLIRSAFEPILTDSKTKGFTQRFQFKKEIVVYYNEYIEEFLDNQLGEAIEPSASEA